MSGARIDAWWLISMTGLGLFALAGACALAASISATRDAPNAALDPAPGLWRALWWPIAFAGVICKPLIVETLAARWHADLRRAGLEFSLQVEHYLGARMLFAALAMAAAAVVLTRVEGASSVLVVAPAALGFWLPVVDLRDRARVRRREIRRQLPFLLDLVTLGVESGMNPASAIGQAVAIGPPGPMREELSRMLRDVRAGRPRSEALRAMSERVGLLGVTSFVAALSSAESQGTSLGPLLRAQAEQRRNERFLAAERTAMQAPVKLLFPLVVFIFPGTFAVLLFPIVDRLLAHGF
ncbi:MAG: type II secretion system F family protein [Burkholderiaceae bacterium]|nr:type II secretion system F family protein [Burkholderiaceae bacterium]